MNKQAEIPACVIMCSLDRSKSPLATPHLLPGEKKKFQKIIFPKFRIACISCAFLSNTSHPFSPLSYAEPENYLLNPLS